MNKITALQHGLTFLICFAAIATATGYAPNDWTDLSVFLVPSDGSRSLGDYKKIFNDERDSGSKIVFFDTDKGDNATARVYWWDGSRIIDDEGNAENEAGVAYGTDPLVPNEQAIQPFRYPLAIRGNADADERLRTHAYDFGVVAGGYPDWYLFRRGQTHDSFDGHIDGGRSTEAPMIIGAYGPPADGRAVIDPATGTQVTFNGEELTIVNPLNAHTGGDTAVFLHEVLYGLELHQDIGHLGAHTGVSRNGSEVPSLLIEDCKFVNAGMVYMPRNTVMHRSISAFRWLAEAHNQAYFTSDFMAAPTFDEVIFYKNGYKTDPRINPDPVRDIFSRNIYEGGGAQMGHTYRNIISADGASGGPQMRLGGLCENSLIIEGYWFSSTESNSTVNPWLTAGNQTGRSAIVRNNVQFIFRYPTSNDPDTDGASDSRAQPGNGYTLQGASFGSHIENNIVSHAMLTDDLGQPDGSSGHGFMLAPTRAKYEDSTFYTQRYDTITGNIAYRTASGLSLEDDWTDVMGNRVEGNVFVAKRPIDDRSENIVSDNQLAVGSNRFYCDTDLPEVPYLTYNNSVAPYADAAETEEWPDPDRTLKRYVTEVLNLTLLDWEDDPFLDADAVGELSGAGEAYDPAGLKTFMAVATNMRFGGTQPAPASGKPSWTGDYAWDTRYTAIAVVNWVREGFGMAPLRTVPRHKPNRRNTTGLFSLSEQHSRNGNIRFMLHTRTGVKFSLRLFDLNGKMLRDLGTHVTRGNATPVFWNGTTSNGVVAGGRLCIAVCSTAAGDRVALKFVLQR